MTESTLLTLYRSRVLPEWVDYNNHMNDACYGIAFSRAVDNLMDHIGLDADFRARTGFTIYTLESHICYLQEIAAGEPLTVSGQLLDRDEKRLRVFFVMEHDSSGDRLATSEQMLMCIDQSVTKAAPFPPEVEAKVAELWRIHQGLPVPEQAGRSIGIRRR